MSLVENALNDINEEKTEEIEREVRNLVKEFFAHQGEIAILTERCIEIKVRLADIKPAEKLTLEL